jgi:PAS domain S-box-containing protein
VAVLQARQPFRNFEHRTWSPDGRTIWISVSGRPLFDRDGRFIGYRGVSSDITDRKRAEERLGLALEAGRIIAWERDLATGQVTRSPNAERVYGATPRDAAWFLNSVHPEDRELHERLIADAVATEGSYEIEFRFIRPDGETIWLATRAEVKTGRDGSRRLFGVTSDITARKRAEVLALENAALLNATLGNMDQGLIMVDGEGILQVCNRRAIEMLDLPAHYATSKPSFSDFIGHQASIGEFAGATEQNAPWLKLRGNLLSAPPVYERTRPNGSVLEIRTVHLADGGAVRTFTDITARRRAKAELRQSEERYRALVAATAAIFWRAAPDGLITDVIGWDVYSGQDAAGYAGEGWLASVHPEDRAHAASEWRSAVAAGRLSDIEYRVQRADGTYRWISDRGAPIRNPDGTVREWVGTVTDIHERRVAQEELARREEQYRALIRASASIVWRADASGSVLEDVVGWDALTGQAAEGHRGGGWLTMVHPEDLPNVVAVWERLLATGEAGENEFRVRQEDGLYRWVSTRAVPLKNRDGSIREWVGTMTDIHDRKESEARLRQSREELQAALDANRVLLENSLDVICTIDGKARSSR